MIKFNKKNSTFKDKVEKIKQKINKKDPSYVGLGLLQNNRHMDPRQAHMLGLIYIYIFSFYKVSCPFF